MAAAIPTTQKRLNAEREADEAIAGLTEATEEAHLPIFLLLAERLYEVACEDRLLNTVRDPGEDRRFLDDLSSRATDEILSEGAAGDEWQRHARRGCRFPFRRQALREQIRWHLERDSRQCWLKRFGLEHECVRAKVLDSGTAPARAAEVRNPTNVVDAPISTPASCRRKAVQRILDQKGWSATDWAAEAQVDPHTAIDYLDGRTRPRQSSRVKMARALGVDVTDLPA